MYFSTLLVRNIPFTIKNAKIGNAILPMKSINAPTVTLQSEDVSVIVG